MKISIVSLTGFTVILSEGRYLIYFCPVVCRSLVEVIQMSMRTFRTLKFFICAWGYLCFEPLFFFFYFYSGFMVTCKYKDLMEAWTNMSFRLFMVSLYSCCVMKQKLPTFCELQICLLSCLMCFKTFKNLSWNESH